MPRANFEVTNIFVDLRPNWEVISFKSRVRGLCQGTDRRFSRNREFEKTFDASTTSIMSLFTAKTFILEDKDMALCISSSAISHLSTDIMSRIFRRHAAQKT